MITKKLVAKILWLLPLAWAPSACSSNGAVDIGHDVAKLSDYAASWDGYAEAATFPKAGSDRVRLHLDDRGEGTLEIGDAPALPAPTQAEGGYNLDSGAGGAGGAATAFRDGFKYPVHQARVEAGRIRFGIDPLDLYGAWCALVPPMQNENAASGYACGGDGGSINFDSNTCEFQRGGTATTEPIRTAVDCGIFRLCVGAGVCTCTALTCGPHVIPTAGTSLDSYPVVIDAAIDNTGAMLTGTLAIKDGVKTERITIRMAK